MNEPLLRFTLDQFPEKHFHVVRFKGTEELCKLFDFEILLACEDPQVDLDKVLQSSGTLHVRVGDEDAVFQGVVSSAENVLRAGKFSLYRLNLAPNLQRFTLSSDNRIFLDKKLDDLVKEVFNQAQWNEGMDFEATFKHQHPLREFICQYDETDYNFLARKLENGGAFFFFDKGDQGDKCVIADEHVFKDCPGSPFEYVPPTGMDQADAPNHIRDFCRRLAIGPGKVSVRDVNYRTPLHVLLGDKDVPPLPQNDSGSITQGEIHLFGLNVKETKECVDLAENTAKHLACERERFKGAGYSAHFRPGRIFELKTHPENDYNRRYLLTKVVHEGHQENYLANVLNLHLPKESGEGPEACYKNTFWAIPEDTPYKPALQTTRPFIHGIMNAFIDAEGSQEYAKMDEHGRYKVILPLDLSGRKDGKASAWIRMSQPYAGGEHGMHLPLHKGCEVALMFHDGDPDRPIIMGALSNPENASPVNSKNPAENVFSTAHGNILSMDDTRGRQRITMHNKRHGTLFRLGAGSEDNTTTLGASNETSASSTTTRSMDSFSSSTQGSGATSDGNDDASEAQANALRDFIKSCTSDFSGGKIKGLIDPEAFAKIWKEFAKDPFSGIDPNHVNDDGQPDSEGKHGIKLNTPGYISCMAGGSYSLFLGENLSILIGPYWSARLGLSAADISLKAALLSSIFVTAPAAIISGCSLKDIGMAPLALAPFIPAKLKMYFIYYKTSNLLSESEVRPAKYQLDVVKEVFKGDDERSKALVEEYQGEVNEANAATETLGEQKNRLDGECNTLRGEVSKLQTEINDLSESKTTANGEVSNLTQEKNRLLRANRRLKAECNRGAQEMVEIMEDINELSGDLTALHTSRQALRAEKAELAGEKTTLATEISELSGEKVTL